MKISIKKHLLVITFGIGLGLLWAYAAGFLPAIFGDLSKLNFEGFDFFNDFYATQNTQYFIMTSLTFCFFITAIFHTIYLLLCLIKDKRNVPIIFVIISFFLFPLAILIGLITMIPTIVLDLYYLLLKKQTYYVLPYTGSNRFDSKIQSLSKQNDYNLPLLKEYHTKVKKYKSISIIAAVLIVISGIISNNGYLSGVIIVIGLLIPYFIFQIKKQAAVGDLYALLAIECDSHAYFIAMHDIFEDSTKAEKKVFIQLYAISLLYDEQYSQLEQILKEYPIKVKSIRHVGVFNCYIALAKKQSNISQEMDYTQKKEIWIQEKIHKYRKRNIFIVAQLLQRLDDIRIDSFINQKNYPDAINLLNKKSKYQKNMLEILLEKSKLGYCYYQLEDFRNAKEALLYVKEHGSNIALLKPYITLLDEI